MSETNTPSTAMLLESVPLLSSVAVSNQFISELTQIVSSVAFEPGTPIASRGAPLESCWIVLQGQVQMHHQVADHRNIVIDSLRTGACFGEACFFESPLTEYDYIAGEDAVLLELPKEQLDAVMRRFPDDAGQIETAGRRLPITSFLAEQPLFCSLADDKLCGLADRLERIQCREDEVLVREGDRADFLYIVERGKLAAYSEKDRATILSQIGRGDIIGEIALLERTHRTASVKVTEDATLLRLSRTDFWELVRAQDDLYRSIRKIADRRQPPAPDTGAAATCQLPADKKPAEDDVGAIDLEPAAVKPPLRIGPARYPLIRQQSQMDCSAACLATICSYYGTRTNLNQMRERLRVGRSGASLANIIRGAKEIGFDTCAYRSTWEQLRSAPLPAISNWNGYHWVVVYRVGRNKIKVADPALGMVDYTRETFEKSWTRFTLFLSPTAAFKQLKPARRSFRRFLPPILEQKRILGEVMLSSLTLKFFAIFLPLLNMHIIDNVLLKSDTRMFLPSIAAVVVLSFFQLLVMYFRQNLALYTGKKISLSIMTRFYRHLLALPLPYFERRNVGDITTRFGQNDTIITFLTENGLELFLDLMTAILISILFFIISPVLMLVTFAFILLDILQVTATSPVMQRNFRDVFAKMSDMQSNFIESLSGMRTIKTLGSGHLARWKYENLYMDFMNTQLKGEVIGTGIESVAGFVSACNQAALLFIGAYMVFDGKMTVGALVAFLSLVGYVRGPLVSIVQSWDDFQETLNAVERVDDIYDSQPEFSESEDAQLVALPTLRGNISFENTTFRYEEDAQDNILQNINMDIPAGQKVAFVGRSGSGKSTVAKLIYGFYRPNSGQLSLDGFDVRDCQLTSLRRQIGIVLQQDFLFAGTVGENIARGRSNAPQADIVSAAKAAAAHEFIGRLPAGYDTIIKDRGANLSGGQRQRICIARTLLQNPRILILDEATSAMDNETERFVMDNIYRQFEDRTVIVIAHRFSTIKNCDRIFVLDKGTIIETGNHEELMDQRGMYYLLNARQT